jgi:hypothetical protein
MVYVELKGKNRSYGFGCIKIAEFILGCRNYVKINS